ncbi:MAG: hypothetical protein ACEQSK_19310 [Sphingomonadaceae bacterium]
MGLICNWHRCVAVLLLPLLVLGGARAAAGAHLVVGDTGFLCKSTSLQGNGLMCDVVEAIAARIYANISVDMVPHARLKEMMKQPQPETFYFPASAQDAARHQLQPVLQLLKDDYVVVTLHGSGSDASTLTAARQLPAIGVLRGSEGEKIARSLGFTNIRNKSTQEVCARMLRHGRLDGWISTWHGARFVALEAGIGHELLVRGAKVSAANLYVLASASMPAAELLQWRKAYAELRRDGTLAQLYARYGLPLTD